MIDIKRKKHFFTYQQQIDHLLSKNLMIRDKDQAMIYLQRFGYYSLISAYKSVFKIQKNGQYKSHASFDHIVLLYRLDNDLRRLFLQHILTIENHLKSLYSYAFCELYGDEEADYFNVNNYDYSKYQSLINEFIMTITRHRNEKHYEYIDYNLKKYKSVPLWVMIRSLTLGNISKMYSFSKQELKSRIAKNFNSVYPEQLQPMIDILSKFRNVCAHNERLYSYKTRNAIHDHLIHQKLNIKKHGQEYTCGKRDLFSVVIIFKLLLPAEDFFLFTEALTRILNANKDIIPIDCMEIILQEMGFPNNWDEIERI
nr:MAG TPA: Abi-like protein [Herelleviridae sp.]